MEILVEKRRRGARSNQKLKILYLAKILLDNTDANHDITLQEIIDKLSANNVTAERKSLYDDIARLDEFGIKIKKTQYGKTYHYQVVKRDFELAELKLLVDSVAAAKFITEEKSNELIKKIEHLTSKHNATMLQRQVYVAGRVKSMNNGIMENVDAIHTAIAENSKISFQYFQWNVKKEAELKRDGKRYEVSPWGLSWDDEYYYLIGYDSDVGTYQNDALLQEESIRFKQELMEYFDKLISTVPYNLKYNFEVDLSSLMKAISVETDVECDSLLEKMLQYIKLMNQICGIDIFVIPNLKYYFSTEETMQFYQFAMYNKIYIVVIEPTLSPHMEGEKSWIIDDDLCIIEL